MARRGHKRGRATQIARASSSFPVMLRAGAASRQNLALRRSGREVNLPDRSDDNFQLDAAPTRSMTAVGVPAQ
jgi:hypothetical protein